MLNDLKSVLDRKTALFDTCVLSTIRKNIHNPEIQDFLKFLDSVSCNASVNDLIKLEFMRDANRHQEWQERKNFVENLCDNVSLPVSQEMYSNAMLLSYIYAKHNLKGVEFVDLMTSAFLHRFHHGQGLVLVTENHKDFPPLVHDRIGTLDFALGKEWRTIGLYVLNVGKWDQELKELLGSKGWQETVH